MKVSSGEVFAQLIQGLSACQAKPAQKTPGSTEDFSRLLQDALQNTSQARDVRLDRDKLTVMLEFIKMQMSQSVMDSFSDTQSDEAADNYGFLVNMQQVQGSATDESNTRQSVQDAAAEPVKAPADLSAIIDKASEAYGVDRGLITAVIKAESGFDAHATSPKGAMGLMQLMPGTARGLGVSNAYDPEQNVMAGTRYLKGLLERYNGDVRLALAAYNWGMGNLERSTSGNLPEETRNYIARIMKSCSRAQG